MTGLAEIEAPPTRMHVPVRDGSLLPAVQGVCAKVGRRMDPAEALTVDVLTSSWRDGRPAALESAVICPRQNLKTFDLENIVLTEMTRPGGAHLAVWSAHEVATAQETFRTFLDLADRWSWLGSRIVGVSRATGREGIEFAGGRRLRFRARIKTGGRGLAGDLIVLDEAFALEPAHMGSLLPILSTRRNARVIYGSSAPLPQSNILRGVIARGRAAGAGAPAFVEWSAPGSLTDPGCPEGSKCPHAPGTPGCVLDDEGLWRAANPAAVYGRISMDYLRAERLALPAEEFARERLGWGEDPGSVVRKLSPMDWLATTRDVRWTEDVRPVFFVTVEQGQRSASVGVAFQGVEVPHVELADHRAGTQWLPGRLQELRDRYPDSVIGAGRAGPVKGMADDDDRVGGVPVEFLSAQDWAQACAHMEKLLGARALTHSDDPLVSDVLPRLEVREHEQAAWVIDWRRTPGNVAPFAAEVGALFLLARPKHVPAIY